MSDPVRPTEAVPPIQIHDMTIAYHKKPVLWDVDLDVPEGVLVDLKCVRKITGTLEVKAQPMCAV